MREARADGRTMRRDRPGAPEQPGSASRPGSGGPPHMGSAPNLALRLTEKRPRSRVPGGSRAHPGNVGLIQPYPVAIQLSSPSQRLDWL